ncbi:hypothetical protein AAHC03_027032 [Spirometra sp. Aus1]
MTTLAITANSSSLNGPVTTVDDTQRLPSSHSGEKIEVTEKVMDPSAKQGFCQKSSSLLRLFESNVFNVHYAIHYLFSSREPAVQEYLARRLFSFSNEEVDFYLPQLATLFVRSPGLSKHLSAYFSHRASTSIRFAAQLAWLLEALTAEDSSPPGTANALATREISPTLAPRHTSELQLETSPYPASIDDETVEENQNLRTPPTTISVDKVFPAAACDDIVLREATANSAATIAVSDAAVTMPHRFAALDRQDLRRGTTAGHVRWVPSTSSSGSDSAIPYTASATSPVTRVGSILDKRYANATLTKHKRTASDLTNVISTQALRAAAARETMAVLSEPGTGWSTDVSVSADPSFGSGGGGGGGLIDGSGEDKDDRHVQAAEEKSARSRSWINVHKGGSLMQQRAALSEGQLSDNATPFSGLLPTSPHLTRLSDKLSPFLRPGDLASCCMVEWDFIHALLSISRRLTTFSCKEQRTGHLQAELAKLNINLPARVWLPVERTDHIILRIPPSAAVCLNSAEKAPYLLFVEVLACDNITSLRLPPRTGSFSGLAPSNIPNHAFHDTHLFTSPLLSSSKPADLQGAPATTYPDLISLFSADSGSCSGGSAGDEFFTGANALWSTTNSAYRTPPSSSSSCSSSSARCAVKPTTPVVDRPRTHPPSDHHLYCIKAVEIRRRLEENTACQPQRSFKLDPKDPSAAVLKEPLELKARRIQESSPWGHLPGWQLAAVIVKVGDDLRQEQLAYQLLTVLQKIWAQNLLKLWLRPLNIVVTSCDTGLIELVPDTVSLHQIRRHTRLSLRDYIIREHGPPNSEGFLTAQTNFVRSCAAYCLVGYLFQVKDRHNGNILIDKEGHVIHIDYGFMLSASPGKNLGFETSPFKLTSEQVDLMGGVDNDMFQYYKILILRGLLAARKHMEELCLLVEIARMGHPHLPCFSKGGGAGAIAALRQRFLLTRTEESLQTFVSNMVEASLHSLTTPLYDSYQYYTNGIQ